MEGVVCMKVTLVAKHDLTMYDVFEQPIYINKHETFHGISNSINGEKYITINLHGLRTVYLGSDLKHNFMIKESDV